VTDLGTALRVVSGMRGMFAGRNSAGRETEMEARTYYYDRGMSYLIVVCITGPSSCADKADLVERSERALLARLDRPAADGILPDGGECGPSGQDDSVVDGGHTCHYPSEVSLTLYRKNEEETRRLIRSTILSP
jgi:hypothetical protein